ncbi:DinB family protein [Paenibacillus sp. FJAT-26967]|uniref:DinB family protein n=1 Tax=Paenibacillus sp. FJAT-26967 TaxID=1729690 RepID=UPI000AD4EEF8|nr:DinB family protein [Paenibacillus sp. FJAT-26967]
MLAKPNETLKQFADFLLWVGELRRTGQNLWLVPISAGKWSLREVLTHLMYWDKNNLETMVPLMTEGAQLFFVDIEKHNQEAAAWAQSYRTLDALIDDVIAVRQQLLELLEVKYDNTTAFTIDYEDYTYRKFVDVFIHHDEHHKKQIEAFLVQEKVT